MTAPPARHEAGHEAGHRYRPPARQPVHPAPDRTTAIARAIAAVPSRGRQQRRWTYVDAARTGDTWTCVLDDHAFIYVVRVHAHTGRAQVARSLAVPPAPDAAPPPRRPRNHLPHPASTPRRP